MVFPQGEECRGWNPIDPLIHRPGVDADEVRRKQFNIVRAISQRRQVNGGNTFNR